MIPAPSVGILLHGGQTCHDGMSDGNVIKSGQRHSLRYPWLALSALCSRVRSQPNRKITMPTLFHKIIRREIPADIVYEDDALIAFRDIAPQAPVHILFVPKRSFATLNDVPENESAIIATLATAATRYARAQGFSDNGYRLVMNCNQDGGQSVFQIHLHLLAGAPLGRFGV